MRAAAGCTGWERRAASWGRCGAMGCGTPGPGARTRLLQAQDSGPARRNTWRIGCNALGPTLQAAAGNALPAAVGAGQRAGAGMALWATARL